MGLAVTPNFTALEFVVVYFRALCLLVIRALFGGLLGFCDFD